jgi:glycosyltransferase involved in cell wall biosynthesis
MRPLRIVYLGHTARLSGTELALLRLLRHLPDVRPHVILAEDGPLVERLRAERVPVEILPLHEAVRGLPRERVTWLGLARLAPARTGLHALRLARRLRALRPDVVHANTLKAWVYGAPAAALARRPIVWHVHDRISADYLPVPAVHALRASGRVFAGAIIANSVATQATLGDLGVPTAIVPSPVEPRACVIPSASLGRPFSAGIVGRISPWKGQDVFIRALAEAFPRGDARGVVVGAALFGEEGYERSVRSLSAELGLDGRVEFRGFREDVDAELARLDVLVHASVLPEPFGQVVVEGMAAGLPVVAAAAGGPAEIIDDGVSGLLFPPGDVEALAAVLRRLAGDPRLRSRLGAAGRVRANDFRPEIVARELLAVYQDVHARTQRRAA